jgi:glycosyltransferase involved in cell wall biosynthesis
VNVLLLSRYGRLGASSRVRFLQYKEWLEIQDIFITVSPFFSNEYIQALYQGRKSLGAVISGYARRLLDIAKARRFDLVVVEKELLPFLPAIAEWLLCRMGVPLLVDYDDATFHRYDEHTNQFVRRFLGNKIDNVMRFASVVTVGNEYLGERARLAGARHIKVIPTVVDAERYRPRDTDERSVLTIGWIGTPKTSHYLEPLLPAFERLKERFSVRFLAVGANSRNFSDTPVETMPWTEESEVASIQQFDIGIMPLSDSPWERGKCGYKLIQCMACGVPVVASPVGVNCEIVKPGLNGFLAADHDWEEALEKLLSDEVLRNRCGQQARKNVESWYSTEVQAPRLLAAMMSAKD